MDEGTLLDTAQMLIVEQKYQQANNILDKILEEDISNKEALIKKGYISLQQKDINFAIELFDQVLMSHPKDENALTYKADALCHMGDYAKAMKFYEEALAKNSMHFQANKNYNIAIRAQGKKLGFEYKKNIDILKSKKRDLQRMQQKLEHLLEERKIKEEARLESLRAAQIEEEKAKKRTASISQRKNSVNANTGVVRRGSEVIKTYRLRLFELNKQKDKIYEREQSLLEKEASYLEMLKTLDTEKQKLSQKEEEVWSSLQEERKALEKEKKRLKEERKALKKAMADEKKKNGRKFERA
eukprot:TRINITY_DN471_c0_g3_i3.p2 TRINITY_DN471_c0_g3~~TRINITY_DN471_c0_g3_i3.p2  ORF type:complete len:299 (-),score=69.83 TRINITY_DN471_c0_g3_i3:1154-2050(-)